MNAADVAHVVAWEQATGIKLNLAFNAVGACTAPNATDESNANCTGSVTDSGATYTDPGQDISDPTAPNGGAFVDALLANQSDFNWMTHTWSHQFLGCNVWQQQALTSATSGSGGGSLSGPYNYEITAATAYGESEPSVTKAVTVSTGGSATLSWPDATNGSGSGSNGPTLAQLEADPHRRHRLLGLQHLPPGAGRHVRPGRSGRREPGRHHRHLQFTDTGATSPGEAPGSSVTFPTATDPGIDCASGANSWEPVTSTSPDASIGQEIGFDQAFAAANGLTNYSPAVVVTGEHSGLENPNMPAALAAIGITTFAADASRQPSPYTLTSGNSVANSAPRYPSNIYYNASNWTDQLNEYNTLYVEERGLPGQWRDRSLR